MSTLYLQLITSAADFTTKQEKGAVSDTAVTSQSVTTMAMANPGNHVVEAGVWGGGPPGPGGGARSDGASKSSYVGIASLNTSVRDKKNLLEIRLERTDFNVNFNLSQAELDHLLTKLGIDSSHFLGASCCPEGRGVIYVTLHPSVNIQRFLHKNECFELKKGIRTGVIRPAGKKEQSVTISGLHPNTKDQAVTRYLAAHGKVSTADRVIHHVYPGAPGSSLCAGKLNGNRTYMVEITKPMGSYHIIDGEKVSVKYRGQDRTCARCHKTESVCPGKAIARDCTSERILLSVHMEEHWEKVGYKPDASTSDLSEADELDVQVGRKDPEPAPPDSLRPDYTSRYSSVLINGFSKSASEKEVYDILLEGGLPASYHIQNIQKSDKNGQLRIENLEPSVCLSLSSHIHGKQFFSRKVFVTSIVEKTPEKEAGEEEQAESTENEISDEESEVEEVSTVSKAPCAKLFSDMPAPSSKRPARSSPEVSSEKGRRDKKKKKSTKSENTALRASSRNNKAKN